MPKFEVEDKVRVIVEGGKYDHCFVLDTIVVVKRIDEDEESPGLLVQDGGESQWIHPTEAELI